MYYEIHKMQLPKSDPKKDPLKEQYRAFHITINTNYTNQIIIGPLRKVYEYIIKHANKFLVGRPGGRLLEVKQYYNVERSTKQHRYHIHAYFTAKTLGFSLFDLNKLRTFVNTNLRQVQGFVRSNIRVQPLKLHFDLEEYIDKDPIEEEGDKEKFEITPVDEI
jgi:hypothetical protein